MFDPIKIYIISQLAVASQSCGLENRRPTMRSQRIVPTKAAHQSVFGTKANNQCPNRCPGTFSGVRLAAISTNDQKSKECAEIKRNIKKQNNRNRNMKMIRCIIYAGQQPVPGFLLKPPPDSNLCRRGTGLLRVKNAGIAPRSQQRGDVRNVNRRILSHTSQPL